MRHLKVFENITERTAFIRKLFLPYVTYTRDDSSLTYDGNYILNGLVLHLDGINYGGEEGYWKDLKRNIIFTNNGCTLDDDNWNISNAGTLNNSDTFSWSQTTCTIEACYYTANNTGIIFSPKSSNTIALGLYSNKTFIMGSSSGKTWNVASGETNGTHTVSINNTRAMFDKTLMTSSTNNNWSAGTYNGIGGRSQGTWGFTGKIYSLRIYNRILTEAEMRHNQDEDIKRFLS